MCTREPRLVLVSLLIGWKSGARNFNQSLSEVVQNQSNSLITFDTQLKTALLKWEMWAKKVTAGEYKASVNVIDLIEDFI